MLKEGHIHGLADGVGLVGIKDDLSAVVALLQSRQDVGGVIGTVAVAGDMAGPVTLLGVRERVKWLMGIARLRTRAVVGLSRSTERQGKANGLGEDIGHLHCDERQEFRSTIEAVFSELEKRSTTCRVVAPIYICSALQINCRSPCHHGETCTGAIFLPPVAVRWRRTTLRPSSGETGVQAVGMLESKSGARRHWASRYRRIRRLIRFGFRRWR